MRWKDRRHKTGQKIYIIQSDLYSFQSLAVTKASYFCMQIKPSAYPRLETVNMASVYFSWVTLYCRSAIKYSVTVTADEKMVWKDIRSSWPPASRNFRDFFFLLLMHQPCFLPASVHCDPSPPQLMCHDVVESRAVALSCSRVRVSGWWYLFGRWPFSRQQHLLLAHDEMRFGMTYGQCVGVQARRLLMSYPLAYLPAVLTSKQMEPHRHVVCIKEVKKKQTWKPLFEKFSGSFGVFSQLDPHQNLFCRCRHLFSVTVLQGRFMSCQPLFRCAFSW